LGIRGDERALGFFLSETEFSGLENEQDLKIERKILEILKS
jgi:hypothetical protein